MASLLFIDCRERAPTCADALSRKNKSDMRISKLNGKTNPLNRYKIAMQSIFLIIIAYVICKINSLCKKFSRFTIRNAYSRYNCVL